MRLGKEQAAGFVADIETEIAVPAQSVPVPVMAVAPEPALAADELIAVPR